MPLCRAARHSHWFPPTREFPKRSSWNDVMPFHQVAHSADGSDGHKVSALLQRNVRLSLHDLEWSKPEQHNNHQETYWRPILGVSIISSIQDVSDTAIWSINTIHVVNFRCAFICTSLCILPYIFLYQDKSSLWHQLLPGFGAGTPYSPEEFKRKKNTTRMPQKPVTATSPSVLYLYHSIWDSICCAHHVPHLPSHKSHMVPRPLTLRILRAEQLAQVNRPLLQFAGRVSWTSHRRAAVPQPKRQKRRAPGFWGSRQFQQFWDFPDGATLGAEFQEPCFNLQDDFLTEGQGKQLHTLYLMLISSNIDLYIYINIYDPGVIENSPTPPKQHPTAHVWMMSAISTTRGSYHQCSIDHVRSWNPPTPSQHGHHGH